MRTPALRDFLAASSKNFAMLPEMAALESFKGDAAYNLKRSLEIVGAFPKAPDGTSVKFLFSTETTDQSLEQATEKMLEMIRAGGPALEPTSHRR